MDIIKPAGTNQTKRRPIIFALALVLIVCISLWGFNQPAGSQKVARDQIWTSQIQQGELALQVEGYGKLKSKEQRLLSAPANAIVEEIVLKPGALVTKDSVIVRLSNPEIKQQVKDASRELANLKNSYLQLELNQKREILAQQASQEELLSKLEIAQLKVEAEQKLVAKGIVSELTFKRSQLDHRQLSRRIDIEGSRLNQLRQVHIKELDIQQDKIAQQQEQLAVISERFEKLTVKAGLNGVLQNLPIELGQSVALGQQVALVGSVNELYAMINISQAQMAQIKINQPTIIDTREGKIEGFVSRISPVIEQGSVAVEIALTSELPNNARPELNVDGVISIGSISNALYLKKPVNAARGLQTKLFRIAPNSSQAELVNITYGQESGEFIEVLDGAQLADTFILSDMSRWQDSPTIAITN